MGAVKDRSGMRPDIGDTEITLPITFDYSGGRKDKNKSVKLWSVIIGIVGFIVSLGVLFSKQAFYVKIPLAILFALGFSLFIRFVMLKEGKRKEAYKGLIAKDFERDYKDFWGIYNVEDIHPYYCRFRNGKSGLYIRLNKDVILGKYSESEYQHYEAIADAYNLAGAGRVQMVHIDYMDNVGTDERLEDSFSSLEDVSNPDLKDLLTDIFSYQQTNMNRRVTTFDVYAFLWTGNDITAWNTISRILNCFLDANYRSYEILNERSLRELTKVIFNLNDFSVSDASSYAFETTGHSSITPISLVDEEGNVTIFNKTLEEKEAERKAMLEAQEAQRKEMDRRKKNKKKKNKNEVTEEVYDDIF